MAMEFFRRSNSPAPPRKISSPESGKTLEIRAEDVRLIMTSWKDVTQKHKTGIAIFCAVLNGKPELCEIFNIPKSSSVDGTEHNLTDLGSIPKVQEHGERIAIFLDTVIEYVSTNQYETKLVPMIRKIGLMHCKFRHVRFEAQYWLLFKMAILENITGIENVTDRTFLAWNKLLMFVISEMKDAFNAGVLNNTWPDSDPEEDTFEDEIFFEIKDAFNAGVLNNTWPDSDPEEDTFEDEIFFEIKDAFNAGVLNNTWPDSDPEEDTFEDEIFFEMKDAFNAGVLNNTWPDSDPEEDTFEDEIFFEIKDAFNAGVLNNTWPDSDPEEDTFEDEIFL